VAVGVLLVYILWLWNWPKLLFVASVGLTIFCWLSKRSWKQRDEKSLTYMLFDKSVEFFVPLTAVLVFYAILSLVVDGASDRATLGRLEELERGLDTLYSYLGWFKIKPLVAAAVIAGVIAMDLFLSIFFKYRDLASRYKTYALWSKRVSTVVLLLCCFTFFGSAVAEKRAHLRARTDKIREGYARLREDAEEILAASVQQKLYDKVQTVYLPEVLPVFDTFKKAKNQKIEDLRVSLKYAEALGVRDDIAQEVIRRHEALAGPAPGTPEEPIRYSESEPVQSEPAALREAAEPPPETTEASVEKSLGEANVKRSFRSRVVSLLKMDGTKQLFVQFPKSLTGAAKSAVFKAAMLKYPMLEPVVDVFVGTLDKAVEQKVKASVDKVADALLRDPQGVEAVVSEETAKIVEPLEVKKTPTSLESIKKSRLSVNESLREIDEATKTVGQRMNKAAAEKVAAMPPEEGSLGGSSGPGMCSCYCRSRRMWGPIPASSAVQCKLMCPPIPCG
jgi:hypothetical protein